LLGRRPRRRRFLPPPPPEGLPGPAFIVLSKLLCRVLDPVQYCKAQLFRFPNFRLCNSGSAIQVPHLVAQAQAMLAQCRRTSNSYCPGFPGWVMSVTQHIPCGTAGWAGTRSSTKSLSTTFSEANSYWRKYKKCLRIGYPLSDPSRRRERPGTRKAYAGTRPNKNKLMVLVRVQARKWQSGPVLHKRTSPVVSSSFGSPASNWEALVAYRLHAGMGRGRELKPDNQN
jgi:hypothetical protein